MRFLPTLPHVLLLALLTASGIARAAPPSAQQLFQPAQLSGAELSPSGRHVALRVGGPEGRNRLAVLDLATMKSTVVASFRDADIDMFHWVNDDRLVFDQTVTLTGPGLADAGAGLFSVHRDGTGFRDLVRANPQGFLKEKELGRELLPWQTHWYAAHPARQGPEVLVAQPEEFGLKAYGHVRLLSLNTASGSHREVDVPKHSQDWLFDARGEPRVATVVQENRIRHLWRDEAGAWSVLEEGERYGERPWEPDHLSSDGRLFVRARAGRDTVGLYTYDLQRRALNEPPVLAPAGFDIHPEYITTDRGLIGVRHTIDASVTEWFDPGMKAVQARVDAVLKSTVNEITPPSRPAAPWVLVEAYSDVQPGTWYLFNTELGKFVKLGSALPGLDAQALGSTDFVRYKARDGLEIPAWLTLPPGPKQPRALVVLVHGGPWVRGRAWGFDREVQFLASRGYAVLEPEFRGSTGYGERLFKAGWKQWGQAMQDDLADGVRWAVAQGHADPKRVCIGGASYGGYAVLMGLVRDPDVYRCGFEWVGVTDLNLLYDVGWSDTSDLYKQHGMPRMIGDPQQDAAMLKAHSPLAQAHRIQRPLLMAHGAYDVRVPIVHGEKLRDALKARGAEVEWVVYDEGHGWRQPETQIDFWSRVEKFLARHLVP